MNNNAKKRAALNSGSTVQPQDPSHRQRNDPIIGTNIHNIPQQQQPRSRRRLSYPTQQNQPSLSRIQPLPILAQATSEAPQHENNKTSPPPQQQAAAPNMKSTYPRPISASNRRHNTNNNVAPTTSTSTTTPKNPPPKEDESQLYQFIVSLSESCRKHHHSAHTTVPEEHQNDNDPATFCIPLTNAPTYCQDAIHTLQRILPHIETTLQNEIASAMITQSTTTTTAKQGLNSLRAMTLHMCDFYMDALQQQNGSSGFCPQAPHLLLHPHQILPRVYLLFQCLTMHVMSAVASNFWDDEESISQLTKICHTIAILLNHIPYMSLFPVVVSDLIYLSKDLSIWLEMMNRMSQDTDVFDANMDHLKIAILEETIEMIDWTIFNSGSGDNGVNKNASDPTKPEYFLHVPSTSQSIQVLQWYMLMILEHLLTLNKQKRLRPTYTTCMILEEMDPTHYFSCMGSDPDLFMTNHVDVEDVQTLFTAFRQIFLSSTSASNVVPACYSLNIVSRLLMQMQSDWHRSCVPKLALLEEVVLLVGHGVRNYLELLPTTQEALNVGGLFNDKNNDTTENMARLLSSLIYCPPNVAGSLSMYDVTKRIHQMCYEILLESLPHVLRISTIRSSALEANFDVHPATALSTVILRTIIAMQSRISGASNMEFTGPLFQILDDQVLSETAVFVLDKIILGSKHGKSLVADLDDAFPDPLLIQPAQYLNKHDEELAGSKRQSVLQSTNEVHPQKRRKNTLGHAYDALHVFSLHIELRQFFGNEIYVVISRLKVEFHKSDASLTEPWLHDLFHVTRRFQLVMLFVQSEDSEIWNKLAAVAPNVFRFVKDSLSLISVIAERLLQIEVYQHTLTQNTCIAQFVKTVVICGIYIDKCSWLECAGFEMVYEIVQSVLCLAYRWEISPNIHEHPSAITSLKVPSNLYDVLFGFAQQRIGGITAVDSPQSTWILNVDFLLILSATINSQNLDRIIIHWTDPVLTRDGGDSQIQNFRLAMLSHPFQIISSMIGQTRQRSMDALQCARWDDPDPLRRLALWQIGSWMIQSMTPQELQLWGRLRIEDGNSLGARLVKFLIDTAFLDENATVLIFTSRELGSVISWKNWISVLALLSTVEEWQHTYNLGSSPSGHKNSDVMSRLFHFIDDILNAQTSNLTRSENDGVDDNGATTKVELFHKTSARTLCSLLTVNPHSTSQATKVATKHSMLLTVRQWSRLYLSATRRVDLDGFYFAGLLRVAHCTDFGSAVLSEKWSSFAPIMVREVFTANSNGKSEHRADLLEKTKSSWKERQFSAFSTFIHAIINRKLGGESHLSMSLETDLEKIVDASLPGAMAELVVAEDYCGMQMMAGYKLFVLGQKRSLSKTLKRIDPLSFQHNDLISGFVVGCVSKNLASRSWNRDLDNHTRQLCLAPGLVEKIIPLIFMRSGSEELNFFTNTVLQKKISLRQLVTSREMLTLKNFVIELGSNPEQLEPMIVALKKAAIVRSDNYNNNSESLRNISLSSNDDAAMCWVTQNFMFLLVNVVQYKWYTKNVTQKVASLTSLLAILSFLKPADSSQYLPQIMATVTTALSSAPSTIHPYEDDSEMKQLRVLAIHVLSKFVKLVASSQLEVLGQNLTSVVVSLIPTFTNSDCPEDHSGCEEERYGVSLLEWLSSQESLHQYFEEIPFLPPTASLDGVRARLKARGVNFDHLLSASTEATQDGNTGTRSVTSDVGSTAGDSRGAASNAIRQAALRRRLEMISPLLDNDSASVRGVALQHLTSLLRSNRQLFHSLIENEGTTSFKRFVTVFYRDNNGKSRWNITDFIHVLLSRCLKETDLKARTLLATCFGEVGAINANLLEETKATNETQSRKPSTPPWYSTPYLLGLQLVTTHLVAALKAAPSSSDQHKIAFAIQQLLALLNEAGKSGTIAGIENKGPSPISRQSTNVAIVGNVNKPKMDESLIRILVDAGVLDVVEPFWFSEFHEAEANAPKPFPFFRSSSTYYMWLSNWCRYMIHRAYENRKTQWTKLFHSCRTALRTNAGLGVADCLLPYLALDCLCFGSGHDRAMLRSEMRDVLSYDVNGALLNETMALTDRRNAVSKVFGLVETMLLWIEPEADARFSRRLQSPSKDHDQATQAASTGDSDWHRDESAMRIEDMMNELPLLLRGKAAFSVGMHANALRCLEMASRLTVAGKVFGVEKLTYHPNKQSRSRAAGSCPKEAVALLKDVLASLNDYETIAALVDDNVWDTPKERTKDSIRQKEALHDWQGALHDYERAQQLEVDDPSTRTGILKCLLELGHFDSVLHQVKCMKSVNDQDHTADLAGAVPVAVEAAWRLGRWEVLSNLVDVETSDFAKPDASYQVHLGKALLGLHRKQHKDALLSLTLARSAIMDGLGNVARESYSRSYGHVVKLQAIREIEDVANLLCSDEATYIGQYTNDSNLSWNRRLELVSSLGATSIMNTRLVLARISSDTAFEGSLFLQMGRRARKSGLFVAAANAFSQAEAAFRCVDNNKAAKLKSTLQLQISKLKYESGESSVALRMLGQEDIETMGILSDDQLVTKSCKRVLNTLGIADHGMDEKELLNIFVRSALQSTRWMADGGLKEGAEILARFRIIHRLAPNFEKGHFQFAKYVDSLMQSRILALHGRVPDRVTGITDEKLRNLIVSKDKACIRYVVLAVKHYAEALVLDVKHVYQALPRLLSLWFDFTSIPSQKSTSLQPSDKENSPELASFLDANKDELNAFMAGTYRKISAQSLYTAIPQLISRIVHDDVDTSSVVQAILRRVLTKYPAQAMWPLAWIRQSRDPQRKQIGLDIFSQVTDALVKSESLHMLLLTSNTLIDYLYALARKEVNDKVKDSMKVRPLSAEVDLCDFVPPIQAALSASLVSGDSSRSRDVFPRHIPRMRAIDEIVGVMTSKARPKKIRVYVIAADSLEKLRTGSGNSNIYDIGEIHFLLKQEVKGDLRKDARVQDLNNVINRIMSSVNTTSNGVLSQTRRLALRTFCVTCLSEETGLLEWVPHTASLRSMIAKTYNPQADSIFGKRQGKRITNFTDPQMRTKFENVCQAAFFVSGDLTKAAALFEQECLSVYPPIFYWWFVLQFPDPHAWYEARTRFALSTAAWSAVGHVIGLGDRHSENILLDKTSGECVHVDFDCIFDKGLQLPKPEVVPFRLTQNMVDALGPTGTDGIYSWNLKAAMSALRDNRDTLLSVLEPFVNDPVINWKRYRSQQRASYRAAVHDPMIEAKQKMSVIDDRLRGIYNLRNNNMKKVRRVDVIENQQDDELRHPIPLSVEGQVHKMIAEATSIENLVQLYVGWMPWV